MSETLTEAPKTGEILQAMLTENTGRHMLDSGGAYGRHWERNRGKDFALEPHFTADWRWGHVEITANVFHELEDRIDYEPEADAFFERWGTTGDRAREGWFALAQQFVEDFIPDARGIYGDGGPWVVNTYNEESMLSQVVQYVFFTIDEPVQLAAEVELDADGYVLLQIHGGCDVRGGYTQMRFFRCYEPEALFDLGRNATIYCPECEAAWYTDDAYHFYPCRGESDLNDFEALDISVPENFGRWAARNIVREVLDQAGEDELLNEFPVEVRTYISYARDRANENISHCPQCGIGELEVGR